jgi:UDP-N-acetyl-alpha-D-muramoyl-L-alanyl-L-glutamate epimerase
LDYICRVKKSPIGFDPSNNKNNTIVQMSESSKISIFKELRKKYPLFTFEDFSYTLDQGNQLTLKFDFRIGDSIKFSPSHKMNLDRWSTVHLNKDLLSNLVFHIGMVELVSYWKATCSPTILIKQFKLTVEQQKWWKNLYFNGLGEFFYLNGINANFEDFISFSFDDDSIDLPGPFSLNLNDELIIPVGGGKDSVVTLSLLGSENSSPLVINQRIATLSCIAVAGLKDNTFEIERTIDPLLLELNSRGYLNGHTPFSSLVAFVSALASAITGKRHIALSNEASANEVTIPGTHVNHQYSKSFAFERDFRSYLHAFISPDINYFSFLRPLNELQIAALFSHNEKYFVNFKSCNVGSKTDEWCCNCPKCLFTWIMLSPFIEHNRLIEIFGSDLWENSGLVGYLEQLTGIASEKPFECVGTIDEINAALGYLLTKASVHSLPFLLEHYKKYKTIDVPESLESHLRYWNAEHALEARFDKLLQDALDKIR